jgi:CHAT domain-containing protein
MQKYSKLIIIPDDNISLIPFDLLKKDQDSPCLCEDYEITLLPSLSFFQLFTQNSENSTLDSFFAFGDIEYSSENNIEKKNDSILPDEDIKEFKQYFDEDNSRSYRKANFIKLNNLIHSGDEIRTIADNFFKDKDNLLIQNKDASEEKIFQLLNENRLSSYKVIHFACHALYDEVIPHNSALLLSEYAIPGNPKYDGYLDVLDIIGLNINADIVILSACETAKGKVFNGSSIIGLTRSFIIAGAKSVISTLWTVHDEAGKLFMIELYRKVMEEGLSFKEALKKTKLDFIKSDKYNNPYYWAGYVYWGS